MSLSKSYNKQNGVTYVYEVLENYWDKEKKRPQSKRKLIGKIDPGTGEIIPTSRRRKKSDDDSTDYKKLYEEASKAMALRDADVSDLKKAMQGILSDQIAFYSDIESKAKRKKNEMEDLLRRYKNNG